MSYLDYKIILISHNRAIILKNYKNKFNILANTHLYKSGFLNICKCNSQYLPDYIAKQAKYYLANYTKWNQFEMNRGYTYGGISTRLIILQY